MSDIKVVYLDYKTAVMGSLEILDEEPNTYIENPFLINFDLETLKCQLLSYPFFSNDRAFIVHSSKIFTIVEPTKEILVEYHRVLSEQLSRDVHNLKNTNK